MGTRSLTTVLDHNNKPIVTMYRQMDGYPTGHGNELAEFLNSGALVNGLGSEPGIVFNGVQCLAASLVAHFKDGPGNIYLYAPGSTNVGEEYHYNISVFGTTDSKSGETGEGQIHLKVTAGPMTFFGMDKTEDDQSDDEIIFDDLAINFDGEQVEQLQAA